MTDTSNSNTDQEQPLIAHLAELRDRILRALACVFAIFIVLTFFANDIYHAIALPLLAQMPDNTTMIATEVASPFLVPFKLAFFTAVFITMPYILYQTWAFIAPGLYQKELHFALPLLVTSIFLFYIGISFAYFVVFPLLFAFLTSAAPEGVSVMTDISHYLDFILKLFFAFGLAFEVPIATILLITTGITTTEALAQKRAYIIVGAFAIGMLLTPPDIVSQFLLAVPVWLLFESGLILSKYFKGPEDESEPD
jgi:sec-independent protein translocase protein TatC